MKGGRKRKISNFTLISVWFYLWQRTRYFHSLKQQQKKNTHKRDEMSTLRGKARGPPHKAKGDRLLACFLWIGYWRAFCDHLAWRLLERILHSPLLKNVLISDSLNTRLNSRSRVLSKRQLQVSKIETSEHETRGTFSCLTHPPAATCLSPLLPTSAFCDFNT